MSLDHAIAALRADLERLALVEQAPADTQPFGDAVQLARLQSAQAALKLAAVLLDDTDTTTAQQIWQEFGAVTTALAAWKRSGRGWFEERLVRRGRKTYGPYRYFRWRDETSTTHTQYLGRVDQTTAETPTTPIERPQEPAGPQIPKVAAPDRPAWRELVGHAINS